MVAHPVILRGLAFSGEDGRPEPAAHGRPAIVERTDDDFVAAFIAELSDREGRKRLAGKLLRNAPGSPLRLFQPVHRAFYLAVFEVVCDTPGEPRLDPARIDSAGLVVRRAVDPRAEPAAWEGWMSSGPGLHRWKALAANGDRDPDPVRRPSPFATGHPAIDARLVDDLGAGDTDAEGVVKLYAAPPNVCAALGRTILYAVVPVASGELEPQAATGDAFSADEITRMLPPHFTSAGVSLGPIAGRIFRYRVDEEGKLKLQQRPSAGAFADVDQADRGFQRSLDSFVAMLRQMVAELDAFNDPGVRAALDGIALEYSGRTAPAGAALVEAAQLFVEGRADVVVALPLRWPSITAAQARAVVTAAGPAVRRRLAAVLPRLGRFDAPGARHQVRGFVRVKRDDGCPPAITWSAYGAPFTIAPWHERGKQPPVHIALPAVTKANVSRLLPNVTFSVPAGIFKLLGDNTPDDVLKGQARGDGAAPAGAVDWLCGFNIPILTLIAFIVMTLFAILLNIVFWWLPFLRICIPIPSSLRGKLPSGGFP